jgi:hypothetical protein
MTEEFNKWWDEDVLVEDNPFNGGTPAYWAWEGWCAAVKAERQEMQGRIDTLHAMYEQACRQRDELMDQQRAQIAAMRGRIQ